MNIGKKEVVPMTEQEQAILAELSNPSAQPEMVGFMADKDLASRYEPRMVAAAESIAISLEALVKLLSPPGKAQAVADAAQGLKPRMVVPNQPEAEPITGLIWLEKLADKAPTTPGVKDCEDEEMLDEDGNLVYRKYKAKRDDMDDMEGR